MTPLSSAFWPVVAGFSDNLRHVLIPLRGVGWLQRARRAATQGINGKRADDDTTT
jgi:hypothetical protein